jgi:hypothetical protein
MEITIQEEYFDDLPPARFTELLRWDNLQRDVNISLLKGCRNNAGA